MYICDELRRSTAILCGITVSGCCDRFLPPLCTETGKRSSQFVTRRIFVAASCATAACRSDLRIHSSSGTVSVYVALSSIAYLIKFALLKRFASVLLHVLFLTRVSTFIALISARCVRVRANHAIAMMFARLSVCLSVWDERAL